LPLIFNPKNMYVFWSLLFPRTSSTFLGFLVACPFFILLFDVFTCECNVIWGCHFGRQIGHLLLPLLSTKKLFDSSQLITLLHVVMPPHVLLFLTIGTYQKSWFDESWVLNNMTSSTLHWKKLQCSERFLKMNLQLYLLKWILILTMILIECVH
jgi:hypothetical protein